jgi:hypothetical protein
MPPASLTEISFGHDGLHVESYPSGTQFVTDCESREVFGFIAHDEAVGNVVACLLLLLHRVPVDARE